MQLQKRKLILLLLSSAIFIAFQTLLFGFFTETTFTWVPPRLHVKVAFKFILTFLPFYDVCLLVLFFSGIIIAFDTNFIHGFNILAGILLQFHGVTDCHSNHRNLDAKDAKNDAWSSRNELQRLYIILLWSFQHRCNFRPVYYIVSYQVSMQQASKIIVAKLLSN